MRAMLLSLALAVSFAAPSFAEGAGSSLTLRDAGSKITHTIIDGAAWRCSGGSCTANGGDSQRPLRACKRVVAELGQVSAFSWQGQSLSSDDIAACNMSAHK